MAIKMRINIKFIDQKDHKFTTIGHWFETYEHGDVILNIQISKMFWKYQMAVLFHELIEVAICQSKNIHTVECDIFDAMFETEYEAGVWPKSVEAGFDKRCPYRVGHIWGSRFERVVIWLLGAKWRDYTDATNKLMGVV